MIWIAGVLIFLFILAAFVSESRTTTQRKPDKSWQFDFDDFDGPGHDGGSGGGSD